MVLNTKRWSGACLSKFKVVRLSNSSGNLGGSGNWELMPIPCTPDGTNTRFKLLQLTMAGGGSTTVMPKLRSYDQRPADERRSSFRLRAHFVRVPRRKARASTDSIWLHGHIFLYQLFGKFHLSDPIRCLASLGRVGWWTGAAAADACCRRGGTWT